MTIYFKLDNRSNISANTDDYQTSVKGVFSAGDMRRGQSLGCVGY
jgi:glutamate synthase (NADPH/NADH) small chain